MSRRGVLTAGTWCLDRNLMVSTWPGEDGRADIVDERPCGGGSGYNMAANLKALDPDFPVATTGLVGADPDGDFLVARARELGLGGSGLRQTSVAQTDYTLAFASADTGRRTHISRFDVARRVTPDDLVVSGTDARLLHLGLPGVHPILDSPWQGEGNGWAAVLARARQAGLLTNMELTSIEADRIAAITAPCLPHLDLLIVNDHEIGGIAGMSTIGAAGTDWGACIAAAREAMARGTIALVAVHFPGGAVAVTRDGTVEASPSVSVPPEAARGANGAGDAFAAGFVYGWHEGFALAESLRLAHAVAAASLRDITTTDAVEDWRSCLALAQRWGWRDMPRLALPAAP